MGVKNDSIFTSLRTSSCSTMKQLKLWRQVEDSGFVAVQRDAEVLFVFEESNSQDSITYMSSVVLSYFFLVAAVVSWFCEICRSTRSAVIKEAPFASKSQV